MQIKADLSSFSATRAQQNSALSDLKDYSSVMQNTLKHLGSTWEGTGGDAFRTCMNELSAESLIGVCAITSMQSKTTMAVETLADADQKLAGSL